MNLAELLVSCDGMNTDAIEQMARRLYRELYIGQGIRGSTLGHDGVEVVFFDNRFEHAFYTSTNRARDINLRRKDALDVPRVERIRWIGPVVQGLVSGTECYETPSPTGRFTPPNRLYVIPSEPYVVWLEPRDDGKWRFSSAYLAEHKHIRRYRRDGRLIWQAQKNTP